MLLDQVVCVLQTRWGLQAVMHERPLITHMHICSMPTSKLELCRHDVKFSETLCAIRMQQLHASSHCYNLVPVE